MVNRDSQGASFRVNKNIHETSDTFHAAFNTVRSHFAADRSLDEVIGSLANAPENQRARQICEWETLRRTTFKISP